MLKLKSIAFLSYILERVDLPMDRYYELMSYDELDYYYVFSDAKTYELLFLNSAICTFLDVKLEDCVGKKCYEVIYGKTEICPFCVNNELLNSNFKTIEIIKPLKNIDFNCSISIINKDQKLIRMSKLEINQKQSKLSTITGNDAISDLIRNIKNDNFKLHIQPQFKVTKNEDGLTRNLIGAEVLIRRYDTNLNEIIFPNDFISFYEQNSIIRHLDLYVIEKSCEILNIINSKKTFNSQFIININLSCATLLEFDFISNIKLICDKHSVNYKDVMIDITKDEYLETHTNFISKNLRDLKNLGFLISISNSSNNFQDFFEIPNVNFDEVKINTKNFFNDRINYYKFDNTNINNSISRIYGDCKIMLIEIENDIQFDFFYKKGYSYQQGFYHTKPLSLDDFLETFIF